MNSFRVGQKELSAVMIAAGALLAYAISRANFPLFHSVIEFFCITTAALIYVLATRTFYHSRNTFMLFLGYAYLAAAILLGFHAATYPGMGTLPAYSGANVSTQLWFAANCVLGVSLFAATFFVSRDFNHRLVCAVIAAFALGTIMSILFIPVFPTCWVEGAGPTPVVKAVGFAVAGVSLAGLYRLKDRHPFWDKTSTRNLKWAIVLMVVSGMIYSLSSQSEGFVKFLGHALAFTANVLIYTGVVKQGLEEPYQWVSAHLQDKLRRDPLTGLYNRSALQEMLPVIAAEGGFRGMMMLDVDHFKEVNDRFGHQAGDRVLKRFAAVLGSALRENDLIFRIGGDEFLVLLANRSITREAAQWEVHEVLQRVQDIMLHWFFEEEYARTAGVSIGVSVWDTRNLDAFEQALREADANMYHDKRGKNNPETRMTGAPGRNKLEPPRHFGV